MTCRWCGRLVDLPLGDECRLCQDRLNQADETRREGTRALYSERGLERLIAAFEGCTLVLAENRVPVTKLEFGAGTTEQAVRDHLVMFFKHADRIELGRVRWV